MKPVYLALPIAALVALSAWGGYRYALHRPAAGHVAQPAAVAPKAERKVLYWHDPMHPQQKFDKPGKSPFMDMQLVPVYADQATEPGPGVAMGAATARNLGVRYAVAARGTLESRLETVGTVNWNERNVIVLQARAAGFVEKLHARAPLDPVAKDAPLVEILMPEWAGAQEEFVLLTRKGERELAAAARQRLVLLGMGDADIDAIAKDGTVRNRFTLRSPISGVVAELGVREGMTVMGGQMLFRIIDLSSVWVTAEVPEAQAAWLKPGTEAEARVPAWPERTFRGKVGAILPDVNAATRTVRARIEVANPGAQLKPGMFANIAITAGHGKDAVLVPSEAVIRTGERNVVIVSEGDRMVPVAVEVGQELGGRSEILKGLQAGARVVASGQFLLDSEASLKGALARLAGPAAAHAGSGRVTAVDRAKGRVELDHGPIPSLKWPAMQMEFVVADPALLAGVKAGSDIEFELRPAQTKDGDWVIETLRPTAAR